jgi:hypothetical protein
MRRLVSFAVALTLSCLASAADYSKYRLVRIGNGLNAVDFTGDAIPDLVVSARRDNFNAHGFDVVSLYVRVRDGRRADQLHLVPLFYKDRSEKFELTVWGGADCQLRTFRLLVGPSKDSAALIVANRDPGQSFADAARVTFTYLELKTNTEGIPGFPPYYFEETSVRTSSRDYCDVNDAIIGEAILSGRPDA